MLQKTVQEKPWFVKAIGNPVVMGVLAMAAAKLVSSQRPKILVSPKIICPLAHWNRANSGSDDQLTA